MIRPEHDARLGDGSPVWPVYLRASNTNEPASWIDTAGSLVKNLKIEYSAGSFGAGSGSDCSTGTWYADPDDVPGAVKATDADGRTTWTGVNRVRVTFNTDYPAGTAFDAISVSMGIGQVVLDSADSAPISPYRSASNTA